MAYLREYIGVHYTAELFFATGLFFFFLKKRSYFLLRAAAGFFALIVLSVLLDPIFRKEFWVGELAYLLIYCADGLLCRMCCEISWLEAFFCSTCGYLTQHFASSLFLFLAYEGTNPHWGGPLYYVSYMITYILFFLLFAGKLSADGHYHVSARREITAVLPVLAVTLVLSGVTKFSDQESAAVLFRSCQMYAMFTCFYMLWTQVAVEKDIQSAQRVEKIEAMWKQRRAQYELSRENIDLINRKCHDLKHQIAALAQDEQKTERKEAFVREIQNMLEVYDSSTDTGNEALNTILMEKGLYCRLHDIQWDFVADGKALDFMDTVDLYTLFGNALDNAIESTERLGDQNLRMITTQIWKKDTFIAAKIENCYEGDLVFQEGLPVTQKQDKENHGYGLRSIQEIVKKYNGNMIVNAEDGIFQLCILMSANGGI